MFISECPRCLESDSDGRPSSLPGLLSTYSSFFSTGFLRGSPEIVRINCLVFIFWSLFYKGFVPAKKGQIRSRFHKDLIIKPQKESTFTYTLKYKGQLVVIDDVLRANNTPSLQERVTAPSKSKFN